VELGVSRRAAQHDCGVLSVDVRGLLGEILEELVVEAAGRVLVASGEAVVPDETRLEEDETNELGTREVVLGSEFLGDRQTQNRSHGLIGIVGRLHVPVLLQVGLQNVNTLLLEVANPLLRILDVVVEVVLVAVAIVTDRIIRRRRGRGRTRLSGVNSAALATLGGPVATTILLVTTLLTIADRLAENLGGLVAVARTLGLIVRVRIGGLLVALAAVVSEVLQRKNTVIENTGVSDQASQRSLSR
jgi:hypothetical protein